MILRPLRSPLFPYTTLFRSHEARCGAGVLVDRIALLVGGDHPLTRDVGHRGGDFPESRAQQLGDELLGRAPGKHLRERRETRGIIHRQPDGVDLGGARRGRPLAPAVEQLLETHLQTTPPALRARARILAESARAPGYAPRISFRPSMTLVTSGGAIRARRLARL